MRMAKRRQRTTWDFGRKVRRLLQDRKDESRRPATAADLARDLGIDQGTVMDWINEGRSPRARTARAVAECFGVDATWLLDDTAGYPAPERYTAIESLLRLIPADQRERLIPILSDPDERAAWIAAWEARRRPRL